MSSCRNEDNRHHYRYQCIYIGMMNANKSIYRDLNLKISQEDMYSRMKEDTINFISNIFISLNDDDINNHNEVAKKIKFYLDAKYGASWNCVVGKGFGAGVTYNNKNFLFLYIANKAIMIFRH